MISNIKFFLLLAVATFGLSACMKIEVDQTRCAEGVPTPQLSRIGTATVNVGDNFFVEVTNYNFDFVYTFYDPNGNIISTQYNGEMDFIVQQESQAGTYMVIAQTEQGSCKSDTAFVTLDVGYALPDCGLADNIISWSNGNIVPNLPTIAQNGNYYRATWVLSSDATIRVDFYSKPSDDNPTIYDIGNSTTSPNRAAVSISTTGDVYDVSNGTVAVIPADNGKMQVKFCNLYATNQFASPTSYWASANMFYKK